MGLLAVLSVCVFAGSIHSASTNYTVSFGQVPSNASQFLITESQPTSTTTPPSVLYPPKPYLMLESNPPHVTVHRHPVIKLPKIQIRKLYFTSESVPPASVIEPSTVYGCKEGHQCSNSRSVDFVFEREVPVIVPNETRLHSQVDHEQGYNPAVLEPDEPQEMQDMPQMHQHEQQQHQHQYGMPQLPLSYPAQQPIPEHTMKQMLRPALSTQMLDDELEQIHKQIIGTYQANRGSFDQYIQKMNTHAQQMAAEEPSFTLNFDQPTLAPAPPPRENVFTRIIDRMYRSPSTYAPEYIRPAKTSSGFFSNIFNLGASRQPPLYSSIENPIEQMHYLVNERPVERPGRLRFLFNRHRGLGQLGTAERHLVSQTIANDPAFIPTIVSPLPRQRGNYFTLQDAMDSSAISSRYQQNQQNPKQYYQAQPSLIHRHRQPAPLLLDHPSRMMTFMSSEHKPIHKSPQTPYSESQPEVKVFTTPSPIQNSDSNKNQLEPYVHSLKKVEPTATGSKITIINTTSSEGPANLTSSSPYKLTFSLPSINKTIKVIKTTEILEPHEAFKHPVIHELTKKMAKSKKSKKLKTTQDENVIPTEQDSRETTYKPLIMDFLRNTPMDALPSQVSTIHADPLVTPAPNNKTGQTEHSIFPLAPPSMPIFIFN